MPRQSRVRANKRGYNKLKERVAELEKNRRLKKKPEAPKKPNKKKRKFKRVLYDDYYEFIKSKTWYEIRKPVLKRDKNKCVHCGAKARDVHHKWYSRPFGKEKLKQLESVCRDCHQTIHDIENEKKKAVSK